VREAQGIYDNVVRQENPDIKQLEDAAARLEKEKAELERLKNEGQDILKAMPNRSARRPEVIQADLDKVEAQEKGLKDDAAASDTELRRKAEEEKVARDGRANDYKRELENIERERVKSGGDKLPWVPGAPLPPKMPEPGDAVPELPRPIRDMPPRALPGAPGPAPDFKAAAEKGAETSTAFAEMSATFMTTMDAMMKNALEMKKKMDQVDSRMRSMV